MPLRLILSSLSSVTPGALRKSSKASFPTALMLFSTLRMVLSAFTSIIGFLEVTVTPSICLAAFFNLNSGTEISLLPTSKTADLASTKPTLLTMIKYLPAAIFENKNLPSLSVTAILTTLVEFSFKMDTDDPPIDFPCSSLTTPVIRCACTNAVEKRNTHSVKNLLILICFMLIGCKFDIFITVSMT